MTKLQVLLVVVLFSTTTATFGQRFHVGVFGGLAAYNGDLTEQLFPKKTTNGALGVTLNYEISDKFMLRGGYTYAVVGGADRFSKDQELVRRNLSFETSIHEFSLVGEYYLLNLYDNKLAPYIFGGLAVYHFDPYAYNVNKQKVYLKPLSTEGQGLAGYPGVKPYGLTQVAIPFGFGGKWAINDRWRLGVEAGLRKLFTDYLDDISGDYADPADLLAAKGQLSVDMSYRGDEVPNGNPAYPNKGAQRGGKYKDFYYFTGVHLTYRLGGGDGGGLFGGGGGKRSRMGCPTNVY